MKKYLILSVFAFSTANFLYAQTTKVIDVQKLAGDNGIEVYNRKLTLLNEEPYKGIRLSKDLGEGVAWIKDMEFSEGTIEFDVRGADIKQGSFVGMAFHGKDDSTFDAVYLRPFRFKDKDEEARSHGIQYISLPDFTWRVLRAKFPNKYEHSVEPAPDPNSWVKMKIVVSGTTISTYINGKAEAALVVEKLTALKTGRLGFYVADNSGGDFANLSITKTK